MNFETISTILLPFLGTGIGAAGVFFLRGQMNRTLQRSLTGFASGVMVAASIWSLIIPAINQSEHLGKLAFLPAAVGVWAGFLFLLLLFRAVTIRQNVFRRFPGLQPVLYLLWLLLMKETKTEKEEHFKIFFAEKDCI